MRQAIGNENYVENVSEVSPIETTYDATANDSDKSWTVPDGEMWMLNWAHVLLATSADVGNRQINIAIQDASGNDVFDTTAGTVQAASTTRHYNFVQGVYRETAFIANEIQVPIPIGMYLPAGFTLQFYDSAAVAAAADDMTVSFQVKVYKGA